MTRPSALILFLTIRNLIFDVHRSSPIGKSDHTPVIFEVKCVYQKRTKLTRNI